MDSTKKSATDAIKSASKRAIQKTAEATRDLVGNKIAYNTTHVSKKSTKKLQDKELHSKETNNETPKERYISLKEQKQVINELRLI